jgi:two-component system chemotaxis response regulator CheB
MSAERVPMDEAVDDGIGGAGVPGRPTGFSCPRCGGVLGEMADGDAVRLQCRTGHAATPDELAEAKAAAVEDALWAAVRSLEEKAALNRRLSERASRREDGGDADLHRREARAAERRASVVRELLQAETGDPAVVAGHEPRAT